MHSRIAPLLVAATLAVSTCGLGAVSAEYAPVNANGDYVVASADHHPVANGGGDNVVYGDITTGNGDYTVVGDPNSVVYRSDLAGSIPTRSGSGPWVIPNTSSGMVAGLLAATTPTAGEPSAAPADGSAGAPVDQTAAPADAQPVDDSAGVPVDGGDWIPVDDGTAAPLDDSTGVPVDGSAAPADDGAAVPVDEPSSSDASAPAWSCDAYASWYDAQNAYEAAGGADGDPSMVAALDPDGNGIACEAMME
jgi:hypothetical protein